MLPEEHLYGSLEGITLPREGYLWEHSTYSFVGGASFSFNLELGALDESPSSRSATMTSFQSNRPAGWKRRVLAEQALGLPVSWATSSNATLTFIFERPGLNACFGLAIGELTSGKASLYGSGIRGASGELRAGCTLERGLAGQRAAAQASRLVPESQVVRAQRPRKRDWRNSPGVPLDVARPGGLAIRMMLRPPEEQSHLGVLEGLGTGRTRVRNLKRQRSGARQMSSGCARVVLRFGTIRTTATGSRWG